MRARRYCDGNSIGPSQATQYKQKILQRQHKVTSSQVTSYNSVWVVASVKPQILTRFIGPIVMEVINSS